MNDDTLGYRWFSRFSEGDYLPDHALENEFETDEFPGWCGIEETDITDRAIEMFSTPEK